MMMVNVDSIAVRGGSGRLVGPKVGGWPVLVLYSSYELGELSQGLCHDDQHKHCHGYYCYCYTTTDQSLV